MLEAVGADRRRFQQKAPWTRSSGPRSGQTAAPIELELRHEVVEVLGHPHAELDAAVRSGLAPALPTVRTGSGRRPDERSRTARSSSVRWCL